MRFARFARFGVPAALALVLTAGLASQPAGTEDAVRPAATTYPTNAAKIFRWGNAAWHDGFVGPLTAQWQVNRPALVRNQHGMLTLDSADAGGDVAATAWTSARAYGRWEARVRARSYGTTGTPYRVVWELVPRGDERCGARGIVLSDYTIGKNVARMHVRNLPDADFTAGKALPLAGNQFHTYAVEVTRDHISWFVDTRVIRTERRAAALSGATFGVRFRLVSAPGEQMRRGRMQMDWVRYYTLARKNAKSIAAPRLTRTTYADAC